jgi:hypothetical protein
VKCGHEAQHNADGIYTRKVMTVWKLDTLDNLEFVESFKVFSNNESHPRIIKISRAVVTSSFERSALKSAKATLKNPWSIGGEILEGVFIMCQ